MHSRRCVARFPDARVVLVGDGPARQGLENLARRENIADAVEFTGAVDDAAPHIARFACLVVASTPRRTAQRRARGAGARRFPW
jgi:glycosyltransferase involved in cell wall biosynthesis